MICGVDQLSDIGKKRYWNKNIIHEFWYILISTNQRHTCGYF